MLVTCLSVTYYYTVKQLIRAFFSPDILLLYLYRTQEQCMSKYPDHRWSWLFHDYQLLSQNNQTENNIVIWLNQKHIWWDPAGGIYWWCWLEYLKIESAWSLAISCCYLTGFGNWGSNLQFPEKSIPVDRNVYYVLFYNFIRNWYILY